jgi:hypothetical protein
MIFTIIGVVLGGILTILTVIVVENLRKPKLLLEIAEPNDKEYGEEHPARKSLGVRIVRYLGINVKNQTLSWWNWWMTRNAALQCRGFITFHHLDGQNIFGRVMPVRWSYTPEPVPLSGFIGDKEIKIIDPARLTIDSRVDIFPGEFHRLDIAARFNDEDECYGWNNENYFSNPPWRNPNWKLHTERYLIKVTVISFGEKCTGVFRLINDVKQDDFRIEKALPTDVVHE